ncbi:unnamed protein product [Pedinophyceae sp. YPF-701]|nr:unnamed protein product [Pedinophyceae sp. YPF-701]
MSVDALLMNTPLMMSVIISVLVASLLLPSILATSRPWAELFSTQDGNWFLWSGIATMVSGIAFAVGSIARMHDTKRPPGPRPWLRSLSSRAALGAPGDRLATLVGFVRAYGHTTSLKAGGHPYTIVADPKVACQLLPYGTHELDRPRCPFRHLGPLGAARDDPIAAHTRAGLSAAMEPSAVVAAAPAVLDCVRDAAERLGAQHASGRDVDLEDHVLRLSFDAMSIALLDHDSGARTAPSEDVRALDVVLRAGMHAAALPPGERAAAMAEAERAEADVFARAAAARKGLAAAALAPRQGGTKHPFRAQLAAMVRGRDGFDPALSEADAAFVVGALVSVGARACARASLAALRAIVRDKKLLERVSAELDAAGRARVVGGGWEGLRQLTLLTTVIAEALRTSPVWDEPLVREVAGKGVEVGRWFFPQHSTVLVPAAAIHNDGYFWDDVGAFDPARWDEPDAALVRDTARAARPLKEGAWRTWQETPVDERSGLKVQGTTQEMLAPGRPRRYMPYGLGPRQCPAENLAVVTVTASVAALLVACDFAWEPERLVVAGRRSSHAGKKM